MIRKSLLKLLSLYQRFFTLIGYGSCRYYPSCSQYAKLQFEHNYIHTAFINSAIRILKCNQLFDGGIDYPLLNNLIKKPTLLTTCSIKYWLVPQLKKDLNRYERYFAKSSQNYYIIKNYNFKGSQC